MNRSLKMGTNSRITERVGKKVNRCAQPYLNPDLHQRTNKIKRNQSTKNPIATFKVSDAENLKVGKGNAVRCRQQKQQL